MTFEQPRSTFASFKARWIRTSPSLTSGYWFWWKTFLLPSAFKTTLIHIAHNVQMEKEEILVVGSTRQYF